MKKSEVQRAAYGHALTISKVPKFHRSEYKSFLAGATWQREQDLQIVKSLPKTTDCRWGQGARYTAEEIEFKIRYQFGEKS